MNILHIASFVGNVGDNISHIGFASILDNIFVDYKVTKLEIRKFYKNYTGDDKKYFDESFVSLIKDFDLCIVGGGGFLDYWVADSESGTTIDISPDLISRIETPLLICSVGCIPHREVPEGNVSKFKAFLDACSENELVKIILRNDGSLKNIQNNFGPKYSENLTEGLDHAFFIKGNYESPLPNQGDYVAMNISSDQLLMNSELRDPIDIDLYYDELARSVSYICDFRQLNVVLVPHIYSDLQAIFELLRRVDDYLVRTKISISPCVQFDEGAIATAAIYQNALLTIGMRFHANIIPIALGEAAIGLVSLDRVKHMYDSVDMSNNYVFVDGHFSVTLCEKIDFIIDRQKKFDNPNGSLINIKKSNVIRSYTSALKSFGLGHAIT